MALKACTAGICVPVGTGRVVPLRSLTLRSTDTNLRLPDCTEALAALITRGWPAQLTRCATKRSHMSRKPATATAVCRELAGRCRKAYRLLPCTQPALRPLAAPIWWLHACSPAEEQAGQGGIKALAQAHPGAAAGGAGSIRVAAPAAAAAAHGGSGELWGGGGGGGAVLWRQQQRRRRRRGRACRRYGAVRQQRRCARGGHEPHAAPRHPLHGHARVWRHPALPLLLLAQGERRGGEAWGGERQSAQPLADAGLPAGAGYSL